MDVPESVVRELIQDDDGSKWIAHSNHSLKSFSENEIKRMTRNYETILGRGSFGEVYKGVLEDTSMVAVKKFTNNVKEDFAKELIVHREINHKNVVRLIGYCFDENAVMMVTEYISRGNLSNVLHDDSIPIPLDTRLRIAIECADALGYMHSEMYTQVIHGDIKPANILLDDELGAKISDFGISRLVNTDNTLYTLNVIGSIGYMDPLFARNGCLTTKSDVYSFGVVLLELITRKKARKEGVDIGLVDSFTQALGKGHRRVREMFDADITTPSNINTIAEIAKLAGKCLKMELNKRPEMLDVAIDLRKLRKAIHHRPERLFLFSWRKSKTEAPGNTGPLRETSKSSKIVRTGAPTKITPSQVSNSNTKIVRIDAPIEAASSQESNSSAKIVRIVAASETTSSHEISNSSQTVKIVDPTEKALSHESNSSTRNVRIAATTEAVSSQEKNISAKKVLSTKSSSSSSSSSSQNVRIVAPTEMAPSKERDGNIRKVGTVAPTEGASSQQSNSSTHKLEIFSGSVETALQLELKDLYQASAHFLGGGTYSLKCLSGAELMVKFRTQRGWVPEVEFQRRIASVGAIQNNKHIVPLRGYYYNKEKVMLLYDNNMPMDSLARALHGDGGSGQARLDWEQRSAISLAVARGVAFIHSFGPSSVHGNINSSNVLLSSTHDACVYDHGMITLFTGVYWTPRSQKSDVYRFGTLLLELLSRKRSNGVDWVRSIACKKWVVEVLDVELLDQQYKGGEEECMMRLLQLAVNCCSQDANSMPAMCDVVQQIENIRQSK